MIQGLHYVPGCPLPKLSLVRLPRWLRELRRALVTFSCKAFFADSNVLSLSTGGREGLAFDGGFALDLGFDAENDFEGNLPLARSK